MATGSIHWQVCKDTNDLARVAADHMWSAISGLSNPQLLLATGKTPLALYKELVDRAPTSDSLWQRATVWALDEYVGLGHSDPQSFRQRLWQSVGNPLGMPAGNVLAPDGLAPYPQTEAERYELALASVGYADLAVLGVGINGHLAFNEPGTPFSSESHVSELAPETRIANASDFGGAPENVPAQGITVGIATIMRSRTILLLAQGGTKAAAVNSLREGVSDPQWPVTALLDHPRVFVLVDKDASGDG